MESLENIAFNRLQEFITKNNSLIKLYSELDIKKQKQNIFIKFKDLDVYIWSTIYSTLFGYNSNTIAKPSIFEYCKNQYNSYLARKALNIPEQYEFTSHFANLWPVLCRFQADSLEEMIVKMDLAGI